MQAGRLRLDAFFQGSWTDDVRLLSCPDFAPELCADLDVPDHVRTQEFGSLRLQLGATMGLGKGLSVGFSLPLSLKRFSIRHELTDGTPYTTPYALRTSDDTLFGLGDARLVAQIAGSIEGTPLMLSAGLGVMLPTGRTSTNPFIEVVATQRQFRQFGNGTFDPTAELAVVVGTKPIGVLVSGSVRVPLYTNPKGYRGQFQLTGSAGIVVSTPRPIDTVRLLLLLEASHAGAARWDGAIAQNSGRDTLGARLGFEWNVKPLLVLRGSLLVMPVQVWKGEQFSLPWTAGIGVSGIIHIRKKKKEKKEAPSHQH